MEALLEEFILQFLLPELKEAGIEYRHLEYLNDRDIADALKKVGPRAEFREKLFKWRSKTHLKEAHIRKHIFSVKTLLELLSSTDVGLSIQNFYKKNQFLSSEIRDKLINIILQNAFVKEQKLTPPDFSQIVGEICKEFPAEEQVSEYYYYPRKGRKAPGGKLFHRYHNYKAKNRKLERTSSEKSIFDETEEVDEHIKQLKQELLWPLQSWDTIFDRWARTYCLRKEDIKIDNFLF